MREYKKYKLKSVNHSDAIDNLDGKDKKSDDVKVSEKWKYL